MPAELQPGRGRLGALLDQVDRELLGLLVLAVLHHLEAVHDRADRADQVVADPRAQQRREIEGFESDGAGHGCVLRVRRDDDGTFRRFGRRA